jgi:hypothetical protein
LATLIQHEVPDYLNQTIAAWLKDWETEPDLAVVESGLISKG